MPSFFGNLNLNKNVLKAAGFESLATAPTAPVVSQTYYDTSTTPGTLQMWNGTAWVNLSQIITSNATFKGEIANASTSPAYPAAPTVGDYYFVTTTAGSVGGTSVEIGDQLWYSTSGWFVVQRNLVASTNTIAGFVRLATQAEASAGTDLTTAVTPGTLAGAGYTRRYRTLVASLAAGTATTITHGLNVANATDVLVQLSQGGAPIECDIAFTTVNAFTITSSAALASVTVFVVG